MRTARLALLVLPAVLAGCGSSSSTGVVLPPGGQATLQIDTAGGRMDLKNNGPGTVSVTGTQDIGSLPRTDLSAGSTVTWPLQSDATLELRNRSDAQADVRITAQKAHGITLKQGPTPK
jgi:hypothetical protein